MVISRPSRGLITPSKDGQPTPSAATGKTCCGRPRMSETEAAWLRMALIGQLPSPARSAAATKVAPHDAAIGHVGQDIDAARRLGKRGRGPEPCLERGQ